MNNKNNCPHISECEDYPGRCRYCKKNTKKSYFEPEDISKPIPMRIDPVLDQYRFIWGSEPHQVPIPMRITCKI